MLCLYRIYPMCTELLATNHFIALITESTLFSSTVLNWRMKHLKKLNVWRIVSWNWGVIVTNVECYRMKQTSTGSASDDSLMRIYRKWVLLKNKIFVSMVLSHWGLTSDHIELLIWRGKNLPPIADKSNLDSLDLHKNVLEKYLTYLSPLI